MINTPDRLVMEVPGLKWNDARSAARMARSIARRNAPKLTGAGAKSIQPIWATNWFGITWDVPYIWFQDAGVHPFIMKSLAGKTIPMWIDDPTGTEQAKNPKAKTRITASGKTQVLIFRKAAKLGARKTVRKKVGGSWVSKSTFLSYPGAPGRITLREAPAPYTNSGRIAGAIAPGNIGIRWYFPGLAPRRFLENSLRETADYYGYQGGMQVGYGQSVFFATED